MSGEPVEPSFRPDSASGPPAPHARPGPAEASSVEPQGGAFVAGGDRGEAEPVVPAGPPPEPTGDARVDAALERFAELGGTPVAHHVAVFEDVHQRLQELLASADQPEEAGPPVPRPPAPGLGPPPGRPGGAAPGVRP